MFLMFKARFLAKQLKLLENGRSLDFQLRVVNWIDERGDQLYADFMASTPSQKQLHRVYRLAEPSCNGHPSQKISKEKLRALTVK